MGLSFAKPKPEAEIPHRTGCEVCPLSQFPGRMEPTGSSEPEVYMLGEAPGRNEIDQRRQFVGDSGQLLRKLVPQKYEKLLRWNNVVRSHPPKNRTPEPEEIAACRPSIVADIERSKPLAIFGFGNTPLEWVSGFTGIMNWRGRRMPVQVGSHVCWYYAFQHPASFLHQRRPTYDGFLSEDSRMFVFDLARAFAELDELPPKPRVHTPDRVRFGVECLTKIEDIAEALQWAAQQLVVGVDYETNCLRPYESNSAILSAAVGTLNKSFAFPIYHPGAGFSQEQIDAVLGLWRDFLLNAPCRKVVHNLAFEMEWSGYFFGLETLRARPWEDTANAAAIVDERRGKKPGCFSLEFLVQQYFGFNIKQLADVDRTNLANEPLQKVLMYNGVDAKYHSLLWDKLWDIIDREDLGEAYDLAVRRVPTVVLSQLKGVMVDQQRVQQLEKKYGAMVARAEKTIANLPVIKEYEKKREKPFNPHSPKVLLYVLDDMLRRREIFVIDKYSRKEKRTTNEAALTQIKHPLARAILDLRSASGTKSKYIDPLISGSLFPNGLDIHTAAETDTKFVRPEGSVIFPDGLIHTQFGTYFAETGRLSSQEPNLQNFPSRDAETKEVRSSIVVPPGCVGLKFDYGQIEARVIAMFTKDKAFCKALWDRYDVHGDWAERIARAYPDRIGGKEYLTDKAVMKTFRTDIKNQWTFPLFFGAKLGSAADYLNIPIDVLRPLYRAFWKEFEGVAEWQEQQLKFYQEYGYVESLTGRRRHGPLTTNQVFNSPVQGTAAEIVLDAMSRLSETGDPNLQPEINIHDDLTYLRVPEDKVDTIAERIIDMMLDVPFKWVNVPISVEMSCGTNWGNLEEVGSYSSDTWEKLPF